MSVVPFVVLVVGSSPRVAGARSERGALVVAVMLDSRCAMAIGSDPDGVALRGKAFLCGRTVLATDAGSALLSEEAGRVMVIDMGPLTVS